MRAVSLPSELTPARLKRLDIDNNTQRKGIKPSRHDYLNKQEYFYLVESLKFLSEYFGITQTRVAFMALYDAKFNKEIIAGKELKEIVKYLEKQA